MTTEAERDMPMLQCTTTLPPAALRTTASHHPRITTTTGHSAADSECDSSTDGIAYASPQRPLPLSSRREGGGGMQASDCTHRALSMKL
jgi:hypothetical protein